MSVVTSVLLTVSCCEEGFSDEPGDPAPKLDRINQFLQQGRFAPLTCLTPHMSGNKHPQTYTYGAGYNHFVEELFTELIQSMNWSHPENVVFIMQPEEGETRVWRPEPYPYD